MEPTTLTASTSSPRRRSILCLAVLLTSGIGACQPTDKATNTMQTENKDVVYFDVSTFDYLNRPIFEIRLNGKEVGSGGGALMTGVAVPLGPQVVTWRLGGPEGMTGNGDTVKAVNQPVLANPDNKLTYLGVHIYPDNTVELVPSEFWPERTDRGQAIIDQEQEKKNVQ